MKNRIKSRDWEALSAYLDGQLSDRERTRLETRLESEPELQTALEELRQTQGLMRNLPKLKAPRNYTLTPEMVGLKREIPRIVPLLRYVSVLAMILLAVVVIGDFMTPVPPSFSPATEQTFDVYVPPAASEQVTEIQEQALEAPAAEALTEEAEGESRAPVMKVQESTPTVSPTSINAMPYPAVEGDFSSQESVPQNDLSRDSLFRVFEIGLAIIAIGAGIIAIILRRGAAG
jgi:anti-sigma factor RsiW